MDLLARIKEIIEPVVEDMGAELVQATLFNKGGRLTLYVAVDKENGVNVEDLSSISNKLGTALDEAAIMKGRYNLEVSSPGIERPLTKPQHFKRFAGSKVRLKTKLPIDGSRNFVGDLVSADEERINLTVDGKELVIRYDNIAKANLKVDF